MTLDLSDEESAALLAELDRVIDGDRYPFSPRIRTLTAIRDKLRPPPVRRAVAAAEGVRAAARGSAASGVKRYVTGRLGGMDAGNSGGHPPEF